MWKCLRSTSCADASRQRTGRLCISMYRVRRLRIFALSWKRSFFHVANKGWVQHQNAAAPGYHTFLDFRIADRAWAHTHQVPAYRWGPSTSRRDSQWSTWGCDHRARFSAFWGYFDPLFPDAASARLLLDEFLALQHTRCRCVTGKQYYDSDVRHKSLFTRCISECIEDMNGALSH